MLLFSAHIIAKQIVHIVNVEFAICNNRICPCRLTTALRLIKSSFFNILFWICFYKSNRSTFCSEIEISIGISDRATSQIFPLDQTIFPLLNSWQNHPLFSEWP